MTSRSNASPEEHGQGDAGGDAQVVGPAAQRDQVPGDEAAEHADAAVGQVEDAGGPVDEHHAEGDQRIEGAGGDADDQGLEQFRHWVSFRVRRRR